MASDTMTVAALGRPFTLGMLYDARKHQLIPGLTLWNNETLQKITVENSQHSSAFEISASDSIESRSSLLDVDASLKASFMGGLIEVGGSAKYLNDKKKFKNQSRVTCQYKATSNIKQLSIDHLTMSSQQIDVIQKTSATHVVTGILYGANAFFVFDSEKLDDSSVKNIQGKMEAVIKKIPSFNIEGKVKVKLNEKEKSMTDKFSCKFYGDFILERNPTKFEDAVKTYIQLPKLLGEKGENSVPLKVWLMPLKKLDPKAAVLVREISDQLVGKAQHALEDLSQIGMRCNDSLDDRVVKHFPQIEEKLSRFQNVCKYYAAKLQQTMEKKFPLICDGKEDESSTKQLFEDRDKSPFSHEKLSKWMEDKEREINIIRSCVEKMEGTQIVHNQSELDREVLAADVEDALCFVFTSLESADPCLDVMTTYLDSHKLGSTHEDPWYYSDEVLTKMRKKAQAFHDLAKALKSNSRFRFLIAAIANKKYAGATIYHYKEGILVSEDFSKPDLPPVEKITDKRDLIWYACDLNLDPETVSNKLTLSEGNKKATNGAWQRYPEHPERFDTQPQVMCRERLKGRHYWEVEWSNCYNEFVHICVAYKGIERKESSSQSSLGGNHISWSLGQYSSLLKHTLEPWHIGKVSERPFPFGCKRVGVFLDWPAGTLSYYRVSSNSLSHLHTFHHRFTEPVYPGFLVGRESSYVYLCPPLLFLRATKEQKSQEVRKTAVLSISAREVRHVSAGVYLDWPAGTLSFYMASSNTASHLHTFRTKFDETVNPGFLVGFPKPSQSGQIKLL
ncbi:stonustoxin subunit beta-like [Micropterus dolomieu]|uniref:stonustoxin subunit beta-like n=1 Tax=Micropterus dolomieu TaxID=147949 RepID=UPI001E8D4559|nr:stonustoxin subunit beta-like [Micropterus dolomieu]